MDNYIPHSKPTIEQDDILCVTDILQSGIIAKSKLNKKFEEKFTKYIGGINTNLVNSGRSALYIALKTINIKENDEVIIPTYMCSSVLNIIKLIGAKPILADIGDNYCLNKNTIEKNITKKTKAVILVYAFGISVDIEPIQKLLQERNIYLIEDCAHAIGGEYKNKKFGALGDLSFFSFQATKMLTSGEGGAVVVNNNKLVDNFKEVIDNYNKLFCISDINASLLLNQLQKLDYFVEKRRQLAQVYIDNLENINSLILPIENINKSIFFRFIVQIENLDFNYIKNYMDAHGIAVRKGIDSMLHINKNKDNFLNAESLFERTLSLPIFPSLNDRNIIKIVKVLVQGIKNV